MRQFPTKEREEHLMEGYNAIGIESLLDWPRIRKLLSIGLFASLLAFAGDFILGYGVADESLTVRL